MGEIAPNARRAELRPAPPAQRWVLRLPAAERDAMQTLLPVRLPDHPLTAKVDGSHAALNLGPDEWLLLGPEAMQLPVSVRQPDGVACSVVDVSGRQEACVLVGPAAAFVLNSGCPRDLSLSAFPAGRCCRTLFHRAEIVLWRQAEDRFHLECWRSFMPYVASLIESAVQQTGAGSVARQDD